MISLAQSFFSRLQAFFWLQAFLFDVLMATAGTGESIVVSGKFAVAMNATEMADRVVCVYEYLVSDF